MSVKTKNLLIAVLVIVVIAMVCLIKIPASKQTQPFNVPKICVHIKGAVKNPGMYELDAASRLNDAIVAAGGALDSADIDAVNLAGFLEDGEEIIIPEKTSADNEESTKINLNTADVMRLCELDGIGEAIALRIVEYRTGHGKFWVKEEIMNVSGIGEKTFEKIKDKICVN